jgi:iron complex outermembrane recepter protein
MNGVRSLSNSIACVLGTLCGSAVLAQGSEPARTLDEVIVTAQKREQNLQDTPLSISAVDSETLREEGIRNFSDMSRVAPEVEVQPGQFTNIAIRGVRASAFGPTNESPSAVHIDGVYLPRFTGLDGFFYDVDRIEVLSGPQGTLFGRNASAGVINVITRRPGREFGGTASLDVGNHDQLTLEGALNVPLIDTLAVRGAFRSNSHSGYFVDSGLDDAEQKMGRVSALWTPSDKHSLLFTADLMTSGGKGSGANISEPLNSFGAVNPALVYPTDPWRNSALVGDASEARAYTRNRGVMLQYDLAFSWATLTFQGSYRETETENFTGTTTGWIQPVVNPARLGFLPAYSEWDTEEIRLTGTGNPQLEWVVGLYRFYEDSHDNGNGSFSWAYDPAPRPPGQPVIQLPNTTRIYSNIFLGNDVEAYAGFGQITYTPASLAGLHFTLGGRYNYEEKDGYSGTISAERLLVYNEVADDWDDFTYKVNVAFDVTEAAMLYVDYSTAFKSGGIAYGTRPLYDPEDMEAYEVGFKSRFFDERLQVNLAAWFYDYTNFVNTVTDVVPCIPCGAPQTTITVANAGAAEVIGQSIDVRWLVTSADTISVNAQHLDTEFTDFVLEGTVATPGGVIPTRVDYTGTELGRAPDWQANFTYEHFFSLSSGDLAAQVAAHYNGDRLLANQALPNTPQNIRSGSYTTYDAMLTYRPTAATWSITGYVRNLSDELYLTGGAYSAAPNLYYTANYGTPRTYGLMLSADF